MQHTHDTHHDTGADNGNDTPATGADVSQEGTRDTSQADFLTVAQAALILGVTARTIQRQCRAEKLPARRVETEFGEKWEIDRAAVERAATEATTPPRQGSDEGTTTATTAPRRVAPVSQSQAEVIPAAVSAISDPNALDYAARYVAQIEKENAFLKLQIEEGNRNAAELRAALRKALEAQPRALTTGTTEANAAPEPRQDVPKIAPPTIAATPTAEAVKSPAIAPETAPTVGQARRAARQLFRALLGFK
jgi:excisionase family DNA binding protein